MEGQQLTKGESDLPAADLQLVRDTLAKMLAGEFTRFDVFAGPIKDNKGTVVLPEGAKMEQIDIDCFKGGEVPCKTGMYWWAEGVTAELPKLQ
jgi:basic membrane protein A